jgi:hypothetical protein
MKIYIKYRIITVPTFCILLQYPYISLQPSVRIYHKINPSLGSREATEPLINIII